MHPSYEINGNHTVKSLYMQVMHGGLFSEDNITLDDIRKVDRNRQPPETGRPKLRYKPIIVRYKIYKNTGITTS